MERYGRGRVGQAAQAGGIGPRSGVRRDVRGADPTRHFDFDGGPTRAPSDLANHSPHRSGRLVIDQETSGPGGKGLAGLRKGTDLDLDEVRPPHPCACAAYREVERDQRQMVALDQHGIGEVPPVGFSPSVHDGGLFQISEARERFPGRSDAETRSAAAGRANVVRGFGRHARKMHQKIEQGTFDREYATKVSRKLENDRPRAYLGPIGEAGRAPETCDPG